jgi:hypothetical protein
MLPHFIEEEKVGLPLMRAYFSPAETQRLVQAIIKRLSPVETGSIFYWLASHDPLSAETGSINIASIKAAMAEFLIREGAPPFVIPIEWHLNIKPCIQRYQDEAVAPAASLFSGTPPTPPATASTWFASCISACLGLGTPPQHQKKALHHAADRV